MMSVDGQEDDKVLGQFWKEHEVCRVEGAYHSSRLVWTNQEQRIDVLFADRTHLRHDTERNQRAIAK
jgi:hypothetical protein